VYQLRYAGDSRGRGQLIVDNEDNDGDAPIAAASHKQRPTMTVPCFPLDTILAALNRSRVDYFSLDIEGFELPVLKTIDWTSVDIEALSVEFSRGKVNRFSNESAIQSILAQFTGFLSYSVMLSLRHWVTLRFA